MRGIRSCKIWWNFAKIRPSWQNNWPTIFRVNIGMYGLFSIFTPNYLCFFQTTVRWRSIHLVPIILAAWRHVQSNWLFPHTPVSHSNYDCNILRWNGPFNHLTGSFQMLDANFMFLYRFETSFKVHVLRLQKPTNCSGSWLGWFNPFTFYCRKCNSYICWRRWWLSFQANGTEQG